MEASMVRKTSKVWVILVIPIVILVLLGGVVVGINILGNNSGGKVLTQPLSVPLDGATAAKYDLNVGTGNLTIDRLSTGEQLLASGTLEYMENQGYPTGLVDMNGGLHTFTLKASGGKKPGFQLPWAACNGETNWQIHLNPSLPSDITLYSGGGNLMINLAGMALTRLSAETGGGNVEVVLPDDAADLAVSAKSGGGNVTVTVGNGLTGSSTVNATSGGGNVVVRLPSGSAARIHAGTGAGKVSIDPQFTKIDEATYQSAGYESAAHKIEITLQSGAGDVRVVTQ